MRPRHHHCIDKIIVTTIIMIVTIIIMKTAAIIMMIVTIVMTVTTTKATLTLRKYVKLEAWGSLDFRYLRVGLRLAPSNMRNSSRHLGHCMRKNDVDANCRLLSSGDG